MPGNTLGNPCADRHPDVGREALGPVLALALVLTVARHLRILTMTATVLREVVATPEMGCMTMGTAVALEAVAPDLDLMPKRLGPTRLPGPVQALQGAILPPRLPAEGGARIPNSEEWLGSLHQHLSNLALTAQAEADLADLAGLAVQRHLVHLRAFHDRCPREVSSLPTRLTRTTCHPNTNTQGRIHHHRTKEMFIPSIRARRFELG
jgi:hypothetical protein